MVCHNQNKGSLPKVRVTQKSKTQYDNLCPVQDSGSLAVLRSQPGIKVIIRGLRGHLLHTVTFLVVFFFEKKKKNGIVSTYHTLESYLFLTNDVVSLKQLGPGLQRAKM